MNTTSTLLHALIRRGLLIGPAFFSLLGLVAGLIATPLRAELLVLQSSSGGPGYPKVFRFDPASGANLGSLNAENEGFTSLTVASRNETYLTTNILGTYILYRFNRTGQYLGTVASLDQGGLGASARGPDGNLYATRSQSGSGGIARIDRPETSMFIPPGTGGMMHPTWMVFGPDGDLYVNDYDVGILRFDGDSGTPLGVVVPLGRGGLSNVRRFAFGPDGRLYITSDGSNSVLRFERATGAFVDAFIPAGSGGLSGAFGIAFGPDGHCYVASRGSRQVLRYDGATGAFLGVAAADPELYLPSDVAFTAPGPMNVDTVWFDDALPPGAVPGERPWVWSNTAPYSGTSSFTTVAPGGGSVEASFNFASPMTVGAGDTLFVYVNLGSNYSNSSSSLMVSWCDGSWEHRAYWGADIVNEGQNGTTSRRYMGALPRYSGWTRLEVPASALGLEGRSVQGMSFIATNAQAAWDRVGKSVATSGSGDTTPPTIAIISPANGAVLSGNVTVTASASDNASVPGVRFELDGATSGYTYGAPPYTMAWQTTTFVNGPHTVRAVARDTAGNETATTISVTINNTAGPNTTYWIDDDVPAGATTGASGGDSWNWITTGPAPYAGARAHQSAIAAGLHEHYFYWPSAPLAIGTDDTLVAYVYLDPANPPREIMLNWFDGSSWEHRAFWGADLIVNGTLNTDGRRSMGALPTAGQWARLTVPAWRVGLNGKSIQGMSFSVYDGRATWDAIGKIAADRDTTPPVVAFSSPTDGATVSGNVTVTISATDDDRVSRVDLGINRPSGDSTMYYAPFNYSWNTTSLANGSYTLNATVTDVAGNVTRRSVTVTVNNADTDLPPQVTMTAPANGAVVYGNVTLTATATDDRGIASVRFVVPPGVSSPLITSPPYTYVWDSGTVGDGSSSFTAIATDTRGQTSSHSVFVTIDHSRSGDTTPPTVALTAPASGATVSGNVTVTVAAGDNYGVGSVTLLRDGAQIGVKNEAPYEFTWNTVSTMGNANGSHTLTAVARDRAGNQTTSATISVIVSNAPTDFNRPTVALTAPANDSTLSGNVTVTATASDDIGVASVQFTLDGSPLGSADNSAPYFVAWDTRTTSSGSHVLAAVATDTAGNTSPRAAITVNVSNSTTPPTTGVDTIWFADNVPVGASVGGSGGDGWNWITAGPAPTSGARAHQSNIAAGLHEHAFDWSYNNPLTIAAGDSLFAYVYLDPANAPREIMLSWRDANNWEHRAYWGADLIGYGTDGTNSRRRMGDLPPLGTWTKLIVPASSVGIGATALYGMSFGVFDGRATWDAAGKTSNTGATDTTAPNVAITAPSMAASVSGSVTLAASASDNVGVRDVSFFFDGTPIGSDSTAPYNVSWNTTGVANGSHVLTATARDVAGNAGTSASVTVTVSNTSTPPADTSAPTVAVTAPTNSATVSGNTVTLSANASDNVGVASVVFRIDGTAVATATSSPFTAMWNSTNVANGSHAVTAIATDAAGNATTSASVIISVNNSTSTGAVIWMDSNVPAGSVMGSSGGDAWTWVTSNPAPFAGTRAHQSAVVAGVHDHFFVGASSPLQVYTGDTLFAYIYLDPANVPSEIMLSFNDGNWEHRAYWGANTITYGQDGTNSRRFIGAIPAAGQWVKLEIPARLVGLEGRSVNGISFTLVGGRATWDIVGRVSP